MPKAKRFTWTRYDGPYEHGPLNVLVDAEGYKRVIIYRHHKGGSYYAISLLGRMGVRCDVSLKHLKARVEEDQT